MLSIFGLVFAPLLAHSCAPSSSRLACGVLCSLLRPRLPRRSLASLPRWLRPPSILVGSLTRFFDRSRRSGRSGVLRVARGVRPEGLSSWRSLLAAPKLGQPCLEHHCLRVSGLFGAHIVVANGIRPGRPLSGSMFAIGLDLVVYRYMAHRACASARIFADISELPVIRRPMRGRAEVIG